MANDIHAVLLVPHEGDPLGLLREGPCGARPPRAQRGWCNRSQAHDLWEPSEGSARAARALVLGWDGEVLRQALVRLPAGEGWEGANYADWIVAIVWAMQGDTENLLNLVDDLGTILLVDADGRELAEAMASEGGGE